MNTKQLFCKHIYAYEGEKTLGWSVVLMFDYPHALEKERALKFICIKCLKEKYEVDTISRPLTFEERRNYLIERMTKLKP